ncbi:hypothetical protein [Polaribacter sp. Asnod1-A03]|uniref:hypothetical protein n=1 Tax=Polaribacter sp. Asnod1-A03 TaxID=3160581 RepID=UPI003862FCA2
MKFLKFIALILSVTFLISCKKSKKETPKEINTQTDSISKKPKISLIPLTDSPSYSDAKLNLDTPKTINFNEGDDFSFNFQLENYTLGDQTNSPNTEKLANSNKGQHIHFILDNQPYSAHYESNIKKEIPIGTHHLVAFLSRSYHESVKNDNSMVVRKLVVGKTATDSLGIDIDAPTLIYSRPKGTYAGKDTESILLDFFVLNTELSETGNKVIAIINDEEFTMTEWIPHVINGLEMGEVTIKLKLVDAEGNLIPGPFNSVERKITLEEADK